MPSVKTLDICSISELLSYLFPIFCFEFLNGLNQLFILFFCPMLFDFDIGVNIIWSLIFDNSSFVRTNILLLLFNQILLCLFYKVVLQITIILLATIKFAKNLLLISILIWILSKLIFEYNWRLIQCKLGFRISGIGLIV